MARTHYDLLGVQPSAPREVIVAAYKAHMKKLHPDTNDADADLAAQMGEAKDVLTDAKRRQKYDASLAYQPRDVIGDRYRVIEQIAEGGMGITYLAEHTNLPGSRVCIKHARELSPQVEAVMAKEAQAMWDLRHHAIPPIRDYLHLDDGSVALVMGYIEGPTLHDLVESNGPITPEDVAWITERILNALLYLHRHGVVHGDVKPQNVIIMPDSHEVSLVDFGLSAVRPAASDGSIGYTPLFGAPEAKNGLPLLPESDYYSLAATMIYALSADMNAVKKRLAPDTVPDVMFEFMRSLLHTNPLKRPNPNEVDLLDEFIAVRAKAFGRRRSGMKPIQHLTTTA